jgi:hypothetical protein
MSIMIKSVFVKAHHSIDKVERYHDSLRRVYEIITAKILEIDFDSTLQMTLKTLNDFIDFNELVSKLLVFDAYLRMTKMNIFSSIITQRLIAMRKIMNKIREFNVFRQINYVLNTRNESTIIIIHNLSINFSVLIFREDNINKSKS